MHEPIERVQWIENVEAQMFSSNLISYLVSVLLLTYQMSIILLFKYGIFNIDSIWNVSGWYEGKVNNFMMKIYVT